MDLDYARNLETIDSRPLAPWRESIFEAIDIGDKKGAKQKIIELMSVPKMVVFSDASGKKSNLGAAAVVLDRQNNIKRSWLTSIGFNMYWSIHVTELIIIYYAMSLIKSEHTEDRNGSHQPRRIFNIASDNKSALQAIANPSNKPG